MGYTVNSIIIKKEMNELFEIINDVRNWPELHNYQDVKILESAMRQYTVKFFPLVIIVMGFIIKKKIKMEKNIKR